MPAPLIDIRSEPCQCPPDYCGAWGCATVCVHRLTGEVRTQFCPVCAPGHTWHQNGVCLRCRDNAEPPSSCACWFCALPDESQPEDGGLT